MFNIFRRSELVLLDRKIAKPIFSLQSQVSGKPGTQEMVMKMREDSAKSEEINQLEEHWQGKRIYSNTVDGSQTSKESKTTTK